MKLNGTTSTPKMNCRNVRPREMRARKSPTNGAQATHQAQKNRVQPSTKARASLPGGGFTWSHAKVSSVRSAKVET